jgi:hypothetical protein
MNLKLLGRVDNFIRLRVNTILLLSVAAFFLQIPRFYGEDFVSQADRDSAFIITVPALMSLWSGRDIYLRQFSRYTKNELRQRVQESGLIAISVRYTYSTVFPIAYIQRKFARKSSQNSQLKENTFLIRLIMRILLVPDRWISFLPFGVSLVLGARKNA